MREQDFHLLDARAELRHGGGQEILLLRVQLTDGQDLLDTA